MDLMQRRVNTAKTEIDGYKAREKTSKAQLDEVRLWVPGKMGIRLRALRLLGVYGGLHAGCLELWWAFLLPASSLRAWQVTQNAKLPIAASSLLINKRKCTRRFLVHKILELLLSMHLPMPSQDLLSDIASLCVCSGQCSPGQGA